MNLSCVHFADDRQILRLGRVVRTVADAREHSSFLSFAKLAAMSSRRMTF